MIGNVIPFPSQRSCLPLAPKNPIWVPDYDYEVVGGLNVPRWNGKELLCNLTVNHRYYRSGSQSVEMYETPYIYTPLRRPDGRFITREATPPARTFAEYDWTVLEREACGR